MRSLVTPEDVRGLIEGGETFTVEFKGEEREPLSDQELVAAVVCLANGEAGTWGTWALTGGSRAGRPLSSVSWSLTRPGCYYGVRWIEVSSSSAGVTGGPI